MANPTALTIITVNDTEIPVIEYQGERVLTFQLIDQIHGKTGRAAYYNFRNNREQFIENEDFFEVSLLKISTEIDADLGFEPNAPSGILITETGYLMLVKSFNDDLAWQIQRKLVRAYFRTAPIPAPTDKFDFLAGIKLLDSLVEKLVHCRSLYQRNFLTWHVIKLSERLGQPLPDIKLLGKPVEQTDLYLTNFGGNGKGDGND